MKNLKVDSEEKLYSRKEMLKITGKSIAGVAMATALPTLLTGCAEDKVNAENKPSVELPSKEVLSYEYKEASKDEAPHLERGGQDILTRLFPGPIGQME